MKLTPLQKRAHHKARNTQQLDLNLTALVDVFTILIFFLLSSSGTVDVLAIMRWIQNQGWYGDVTLGNVQFGYEITSSAGGLNFTTNSFSVTNS